MVASGLSASISFGAVCGQMAINPTTGKLDCIGASLSTGTAGASNFIFNQNTLQSGSTFYTSSGTVNGQLTFSTFKSVNTNLAFDGTTLSNNGSSGNLLSLTNGGTGVFTVGNGGLTTIGNTGGSTAELDLVGKYYWELRSESNAGSGLFHLQFGNTPIMTIGPSGGNTTFQNFQPSYVSLTSKGASGQTANLQEWQNSSSVVLSSVDAVGNGYFPNLLSTTTASNSYIKNTDSLQSGATFYVSKGTVGSDFNAGNIVASTVTVNFLNAAQIAVSTQSQTGVVFTTLQNNVLFSFVSNNNFQNGYLYIPSAVGNPNEILILKRMDAYGYNLILSPLAGTIDGAATYSMTAQYQVVRLISDGANWFLW